MRNHCAFRLRTVNQKLFRGLFLSGFKKENAVKPAANHYSARTMASSDIYEVKESPWAKKPEDDSSQSRRRRRRRSQKTFDEAVNPDFANTHRRRSRNSGFRRFRHRMKNPDFSKKFWIASVSTSVLVLGVLIVWDLFFRYPKPKEEQSPEVYRTQLK
jgi:hypothetical protein